MALPFFWPIEDLADKGQTYKETNALHREDWEAPLQAIEDEVEHNGTGMKKKQAEYWCRTVGEYLRAANLDNAAKSQAFNILSYLLHWHETDRIPHGFEARWRPGTGDEVMYHTERLIKMMVGFVAYITESQGEADSKYLHQSHVTPMAPLRAVKIVVCLLSSPLSEMYLR